MASLGSRFINKSHALLGPEELKDIKVVAVYFSAHWCPPCRKFTPILASVYEDLADDLPFEIVFASSDSTKEEFEDYYKEMPWLAIPFGDTTGEDLMSQFNVEGIPSLLVFRRGGNGLLTLITDDGRGDIDALGPEAVNKWLSSK